VCYNPGVKSPDPRKALAPHDPRTGALMRIPRRDAFPVGVFCASPTVLEAINHVLYERGIPTLWVQPDGTIGPTDPLIFTVEYIPSPFVM
jgi:hypothetical protein